MVVDHGEKSQKIRFTITDTGIGMTETFVEQGLFEPFAQEEKSLTNKTRGVGLGELQCMHLTAFRNVLVQTNDRENARRDYCVLCKISRYHTIVFNDVRTDS